MNRVQFSMPSRQISITKVMAPPISRTNIAKWLKNARKAIPQIPDTEGSEWKVYDEVISPKHIMLELRDRLGNKCAVVIERTSTMGRRT